MRSSGCWPINSISRRRALSLGAGGAVSLAAGTGPSLAAPIQGSLNPLFSAHDRIIRSTTGLRPFRPGGFVVSREKLGAKDLIHNYGHGGAGVTLSWGTAELATRLASATEAKTFAIIGAGISGLTTALLLSQRGFKTKVYARELQPNTLSNVAGAYWYPSAVYDRSVASDAFAEQFRFACRYSFRFFQHFANDPKYGVTWVPHYVFSDTAPSKPFDYPGGNDLYPELEHLRGRRAPGRFRHSVLHYSMIIDPDIYLRGLLDDYYAAGGEVVQCSFETAEDLQSLPEPALINCTGLGARSLFGDESLYPIFGQLTHLLPQPEVNYAYSAYMKGAGLLYMFPRRTSIVLGGAFKRHDWSSAVDQEETDRMIHGHAEVADRLAGRRRLFPR